nr:MAG TPA: hypothetical protein [Caudoviricetes sp.]
MTYGRVTPRARQGTTGISTETDIGANEGVWISPPDRVAAVTIAVHIPAGESATFVIETSCSRADTIGENGEGGYWDNPFGDGEILSENTVVMIANAVTGVRVRCLTAESTINVCFVG